MVYSGVHNHSILQQNFYFLMRAGDLWRVFYFFTLCMQIADMKIVVREEWDQDLNQLRLEHVPLRVNSSYKFSAV